MTVVQAFDDWYRRTHPRVFGVVYVACGRDDLAMEATDEAFVRALERWERVGSMTYPDGWVYQVALNAMKRKLRRLALERRLTSRQQPPTLTELADPNPELWREVHALPKRQRLVVLLRYVADLPEADIAKALGVTRGTVSASLAAARSRLADRLVDLADVHDLEAPYA